jgi:hypothetical protein
MTARAMPDLCRLPSWTGVVALCGVKLGPGGANALLGHVRDLADTQPNLSRAHLAVLASLLVWRCSSGSRRGTRRSQRSKRSGRSLRPELNVAPGLPGVHEAVQRV